MDLNDILTSADDERLMLNNVGRCYSDKTLALRVSVEHYRYLVEQVVSLRQHIKRHTCTRLAPDGFSTVADAPSVEQPKRESVVGNFGQDSQDIVCKCGAREAGDCTCFPDDWTAEEIARVQQFAILSDEVTPDAE